MRLESSGKLLFNRLWSIIVIPMMILSGLVIVATENVLADQDGDYSYTVNGGVATITKYNGNDNEISIPSTLGGYNTVAVGQYSFQSCTLTSVDIPNSITSIGCAAFNCCPHLTSITGGDGIISIGESAFSSCQSLVSFTIPRNVTKIGLCVFDSSNSLIDINVDSLNANYRSIDGVLYTHNLTTLVQYPGGRSGAFSIPSSVTNIGDASFSHCIFLTSVTIPESVTRIGNGTFSSCSSLASLTIPQNVTDIGDVSFQCCPFTSVIIPSSVIYIGQEPFNLCEHLLAIDVESDNSNYASIDGLLYNKLITTLLVCPIGKVGSIIIPNTVISISSSAFSHSSLTSIEFEPLSNLKSIEAFAFTDCAFSTFIIPDSVTSIGDWSFTSNHALSSVTIGKNVKFIGNGTFGSCYSLTSITFLGLTAPTTIGEEWVWNTNMAVRGHAFSSSDFPTPGNDFYGLTMGSNLDSSPFNFSVQLIVGCDSSVSTLGIVNTVKGQIRNISSNQPIASLNITLAYSVNNGIDWIALPPVVSGLDGSFARSWIPPATGVYLIKALWPGNNQYHPAESIFSLAVTLSPDNDVFTVQSNSTISNLIFNSETNELSFTVSGESGTSGYTRIVVSKELVENGNDIQVSLDGAEMDYQLTSTDTSWVLYFTYHHSSHNVVADLNSDGGSHSPEDSNTLLIFGAILIVIAAAISLAYVYRKHKGKK